MAGTIYALQQAGTAGAGARPCAGFGHVSMWAATSASVKPRLIDTTPATTAPNRAPRPRELRTT